MHEFIKQLLQQEQDTLYTISKHLLDGGGKGVRSLLFFLLNKGFGQQDPAQITLATAIEFIHTATLFHDDVIDDGQIRRNKQTAHLIWGSKLAILVGDFLLSKAFELLAQVGDVEIMRCISKNSHLIIQGEVEQLSLLRKKIEVDEAEYHRIIHNKTACLFGAICRMSALFCTKNTCADVLEKIGVEIGMMFQMQDDLLDYFGDSQILGKKAGGDFIEGKFTLPVILLKNAMNSEERDWLINIMQKSKKNDKDFELILNKMRGFEIERKMQERIDSKIHQIHQYLNQLKEYEELQKLTQKFLMCLTTRRV
ncbi:polyprenyl synthetase family protein [Candidatus Sarmatiella mevalonica]|uniref:polyprenyl synthetase family protein n=1 Tax=Candidatus Sarmatiella mevalonica TaxID=2770581 RepID=UPI0019239E40|nr:polyprenyl synthetase family protein [Candidatus Sarmatiella mevalonica]